MRDAMPSSNTTPPLVGVLLAGLLVAGPACAAPVEGRLAFADRTALSSPVAGVIAEVPVRAGEVVKAGALLVALDDTPFRHRLRQVAARLPGLERAADEAERDAERVQALYDRTSASDSELETARIARDRAAGERDAARARAGLRGWERDQATLEAPFDARVLAVNAAPGEVVSPRLAPPVLVEIARADRLEARVTLDAEALGELSPGDELTVSRDGDRLVGTVDAITVLDEGEGLRYRLAVGIDSRDTAWRAGQTVTLDLPGA
jgi:RND family efflux transporter MFP subunit